MTSKTMHQRLTGTVLVHGDDEFAHGSEVAPSISVTSTFRAPLTEDNIPLNPEDFDFRNPTRHVYSRCTQNVSTRAEHVLSKINGGYAMTYASGLAASYAALVYFHPKRIAISGGYHGFHNTIAKRPSTQQAKLGESCCSVIYVETITERLETRDIKFYADKVHAAGGKLVVDSTFAPPPLQYPFKWGADMVLHSGSKYFGGHSDLLCGVLVAQTGEEWKTLWTHRTFLGSMMGSLESWLLLRSLRTLHLRVPRQSESAEGLARWLSLAAGGKAYDGIPAGVIDKVWHSSLQGTDGRGFNPEVQLEGGWNPTFSIFLTDPEYARLLPHSLKYFIPATSLGGVESLIEQRSSVDPTADPRLVRISVGVEDLEDLKSDLRRAFQEIVRPQTRL
ncbi:uncharacterized protein FIBRA_06331 [Fibroporia radiculosa]|uniref:Cystathionine gamma-synthase n=1 Tax=Fibroporia radiculosa TaxID=599839 RepID=J4H408_9APHY|nr:uncharacterized protein FIBRA_06331 [Fibroporia radiculosa]CCM04169.1 predicted protein [Fibroporia radiculosa]